MVGHSLLYIEVRFHLYLLRKSIGTWSFEHGNKGQLKVYKIENLVTMWAGTADRGKTKHARNQLIQGQLCLHAMNGADGSGGPGNYH